MVFISSETKQRLKNVLDLVLEVQHERTKKLTDDQCQEIIEWVLRKYTPKAKVDVAHGKRTPDLKLLGMSQVEATAPTFVIYTPKPKHVAPAVVQLVEKHIREKYEFLGTPIFITTRTRPHKIT
jgi:predicted GTPase